MHTAMFDAVDAGCGCSSLREGDSFVGWNDSDAFVASLKRAPEFSALFGRGSGRELVSGQKCGATWRLVEPDPPFGGLMGKSPKP